MSTMERARSATDRYEAMAAACGCTDYVGFIRGGELDSGPHASTMVCDSLAHQESAREWVRSKGLTPRFVARWAEVVGV